MKTGRDIILSSTSNLTEDDELETIPGKIVQLISKRKQDRIKRNVNLEHDNTKSDDLFNRERLDGTLRSTKIKDLRYTRRNMLTYCDAKSLLLCIKACYKTHKRVCMTYKCSPNFVKLTKEECKSMCEEEHVNGTKFSDSEDDYVALDTEDSRDDDD